MVNKKLQGKQNRAAGQRFELSVRKDLEEQGWIICKWQNNVEFVNDTDAIKIGKLISAKHKFNFFTKVMSLGTGFPDFIAFRTNGPGYEIIGVEAKTNGYLDKVEKEKVQWLLANKIFSRILIASRGEKRGEILYEKTKLTKEENTNGNTTTTN